MYKEYVDDAVKDHDTFYCSIPLIHEIDIKYNRLKYIEDNGNVGDCENMEMVDHLYHYNRLISIQASILSTPKLHLLFKFMGCETFFSRNLLMKGSLLLFKFALNNWKRVDFMHIAPLLALCGELRS